MKPFPVGKYTRPPSTGIVRVAICLRTGRKMAIRGEGRKHKKMTHPTMIREFRTYLDKTLDEIAAKIALESGDRGEVWSVIV